MQIVHVFRNIQEADSTHKRSFVEVTKISVREYTSSPKFWRLSCTYELNPLPIFKVALIQ